VDDQVHLLVGLRATHTLADFVRELKKASSAWIHAENLEPGFSWQQGYAAFTVSPGVCSNVTRYIANQEQHHRRTTFIEELTSLLAKAAIEYDPKYLE
jgi:REP element-mobilizing transposase RayT